MGRSASVGSFFSSGSGSTVVIYYVEARAGSGSVIFDSEASVIFVNSFN